MIKPRPEDVSSYAFGIGFKLKGEHFCDFYESKGWLVGRAPMKDWRAAVRTWKHNAPPEALVGKKYVPELFEQRELELEKIKEQEWMRINNSQNQSKTTH